jgi:pyrimidine-nucleoside phosphorylase
MIDLIRRKRDGLALDSQELAFIATGAASGSIPAEQLAAWLMAAWIRGLSLDEIRALTLAMRDSGEKFSPARLGKVAVDKHSTGGVGDKTSFLIAPLAAACGVAVPMISGRALGHTGGTLDKLESIPGFRTALTLAEFETVLMRCGCSIVSQTPALVPADRVLYALRDLTGTVENSGLICASILSKKLAARPAPVRSSATPPTPNTSPHSWSPPPKPPAPAPSPSLLTWASPSAAPPETGSRSKKLSKS